MTLYIIGIGLCYAKDISIRGLEAVKNSSKVYLEGYTSLLQDKISDLEGLYGKKIEILARDDVESGFDRYFANSRNENVSLLIIGDVFSATTHQSIIDEAKNKGIMCEIIHNASIISAIGCVGLEVYKYGKITSIPFHHKSVSTPFDVYKMNYEIGLHSLFLLDLDPKCGKFLTIAEATKYLLEKGIDKDSTAIGAARIGAKDQRIVCSTLSGLLDKDFGKPPYCLVIPGKLHFIEEDAINQWKE